jgi:hypothetical protein
MTESNWNEGEWRFKCSLPDGWRIREEGDQAYLDLYKERWGGWKLIAVLREKDLDITESGDNIDHEWLLVIADVVKHRMSKDG